MGVNEYAFSSLTLKILKLVGLYYPNHCTNSNQMLHSDQDYQNTLRGWSKQAITNPRWLTAAILKNRKRPFLRNALTDVHKIWHSDAYWPSEGFVRSFFADRDPAYSGVQRSSALDQREEGNW